LARRAAMRRRRQRRTLLVATLFAPAAAFAQQQLGTKVMGGLGIDAGTQSPPGLFVLDRFLQFTSDKARGRNGEVLPIPGLDILARANVLGVGYTLAARGAPYLTVAAGVPVARVALNTDNPIVSIDRLGLGDVFVQPLKAGVRADHFDAVASYTFYAPTGKFEPRSGASVGRGNWTHELSAGGAVYGDTTRSRRASALVSYEINGTKRGIDITRGSMLSIQGGAGASIRRVLTVGVAGYGLWQVSDDRGSDLPPALVGLRTRTYGLGPEMDVVVPSLGLAGEFRYEWDVGTRARPQGAVLSVGVSYRAWAPRK
ncbi:MAG: SphA family protein, partial [Gemmatimonadaceae bacterium]